MRKIIYVLLGLTCGALALASCYDGKDFEFDKFTTSDLEPTLYIPLLNDTIRLDARNDYNILYDETGTGYLHFAIDRDILPEARDFFEVPDATFSVTGFSFHYPGGGQALAVAPQTYTLHYPFSADRRIDSLTFSDGTLSFSFTPPFAATGVYLVTIPALKRHGASFSAVIPFDGAPMSLAGYSLTFGSSNSFDIIFGLNIQSSQSPAGDYAVDMTFRDLETDAVYGYFGQAWVSPAPIGLDVPTFDRFRNSAGTVLRIKEASLHFRVDNGAGFPIRLRIDEVTAIAGGQARTKTGVDSVIIPANPQPRTDYYRSEHRFGKEALGEVLSNMPSRVEFKFSAMINPYGPVKDGQAVKNFLTTAHNIKVDDIEARIPLDFSAQGMLLTDTLTFSPSKVTFKDMELFVNVENNMPVAVTLQARLMDADGHLLAAPPLFGTPVAIPAATVAATGEATEPCFYTEKLEANVADLAQADKLKVEITVNTDNPASQFVHITNDNYVYIRIGAKAKVNIDNLDL
jgi:hypothetical protein